MKTHLFSIILIFSTCLLQAQTEVIGYSAGSSVICDCPVGYLAVGYRGGSGAWMDRLDIICKKLNADGTLNNALIYTNSVGATASDVNGTPNSGDIIALGNMALTGVNATKNQYTSFGNYLSSIQGIVTPISSIVNGNTSGTTTLPQFGPTGITLGSYSVPPGNAVTGIEGFTVNSNNKYVGGIKLRYKTIAEIIATTSVSNGNWSDPNTWSNQTIPMNNTDVIITTQVTVDINAVCNSMKVQPTGKLTINSGMKLNITNVNANRPIAGFNFTTSNLEVLPVTLTTTNTTIGSDLTYTWSFGNGTSTQANPTYNFTEGGIYNIKLVATNASGSDSITKQIRISPYPQAYTNFNSVPMSLFAWEGNKVMILSRNSNLNRATMFKWLKAMDTTYGYYENCTGREPSINPPTYINNRTTIADVTTTCGAGCGYLGATGIELQNAYFDVMYNAINNNNQYDQAAFYEFGRNFWFYGNQLAYKTNDPITTGYAVFMRFMAMEAAGVNGAPFGSWTFPTFRSNVENLINTYLADASLNWGNTLGVGQGVPGSGLGATDLFASFCFRLRRDYGGETFVQNVWKHAGLRPNANTTQDAVDNFFLASCAAANKNLTTLFQSWKWTLSASAIVEALQYAADIEENFGDDLSEEDNAFIESLSVPNPTLREMFGHDGNPLGRVVRTTRTAGTMGPVGDLIDNMLRDAQSLSGQKTHLYPQVGNDTTKPAHMGLVYSKGQRDITQRLPPPPQPPTSANALHRTYSVYGTDCSGLIINLLHLAGVSISDNTSVATFETNLADAIKNNSTYKHASVVNLGWLPTTSIKSGDLILWIRPNNNHMGIVCKVANGQTVFQSNGTGTPSWYNEQVRNLGDGRGVHPIKLPIAISAGYPWGTAYKILRIRDTLAYNLTNDSTKAWKVNPQGTTTYCGQSSVNPVVAMDDIFIFNSNGTFSHKGGTITIDPTLTNCYDGGDYNGTWSFNSDQTALDNSLIVTLSKSRLILTGPDGKLDLIPY